jgi:hypothetical protein
MTYDRAIGAELRYIRESRTYSSALEVAMGATISTSTYALYERQDGRAVRVGTCVSYEDALGFLQGAEPTHKGRRNARKTKG